MNQAIKYGFITGLVSITLTAVLYILGAETLLGSSRFIIWVIGLALIIFFSIKLRKQHEGDFYFKTAFFNVFTISFASFVLLLFFQALLYNVIDPELSDIAKRLIIENLEEILPDLGYSNTQIALRIEDIQAKDLGPVSFYNVGKDLIKYAITSLFLALMIGAGVKKKKLEMAM